MKLTTSKYSAEHDDFYVGLEVEVNEEYEKEKLIKVTHSERWLTKQSAIDYFEWVIANIKEL